MKLHSHTGRGRFFRDPPVNRYPRLMHLVLIKFCISVLFDMALGHQIRVWLHEGAS